MRGQIPAASIEKYNTAEENVTEFVLDFTMGLDRGLKFGIVQPSYFPLQLRRNGKDKKTLLRRAVQRVRANKGCMAPAR